MSRKRTYLISLIVLVSLISGAFFAPELIMRYRDRSLLENYTFQARAGIDYEAVNTQYIVSREERLIAFAQGISEGRQYFITSSGQEVVSWDEILYKIFNEYFFDVLYNLGLDIWTEDVYNPDRVTQYQYYVIYDNDMTNGAAFLCWYLEMELSESVIRLLVDAVDYSVYYLEYYYDDMAGVLPEWIQWVYVQRYDSGVLPILRNYYWHNEVLYYNELEHAIQENAEKYGLDPKQVLGEMNGHVYDAGKGAEAVDVELIEMTAELLYESGMLRLDICLLNQRVGPSDYGFRIGIQELFELLPQDIRGTKLQSWG